MSSEILSTLNSKGSGLDLRALAQTLATADTAPKLAALRAKASTDSVRLSALGTVRTQLDSLGAALAGVAAKPILSVETGSSLVMPRVTDRAKLETGTVPLEVQSIATRQVLEFKGFGAADAPLSAGTLTLDFGSWDAQTASSFTLSPDRGPETLTITPGMTLQDLATKLTEISGLTARVLDKGDGTFSLGIVGETGAANGVRLSTPDSGLSQFDTTTTNAARQVQAAADARLVVDGIQITRSSNVLADVLPGMELTLTGVTTTQIGVSRDASVAQSNLNSLITALNDTFSLLKSVTQRGVGDTEAGALAGDRSIEAISQSLRSLIARPIAGHGTGAISLSEMGVVTQRNGTLILDPPAFTRAFAARAAEFDGLFNTTLMPLSEGLTIKGAPAADFASGNYAFAVQPDGSAVLGNNTLRGLDLGDGRRMFIGTSGSLQTMTVTADPGVSEGRIRYGQSFISAMATVLDGTATALLGRREAAIGTQSAQTEASISSQEARAAVLEKRYISRFAAMEQAITRMNNTGSYIKNMVDLWSKEN